MKILIITRIYTSLVDSIKSRKWQPKGMPAYYKLLEALDKKGNIDIDAICLGKVAHNGIYKKEVFKFAGQKINFHIMPYRRIKILKLLSSPGRIMNGVANDIFQFFPCLSLVLRNHYDLIYIDRANVIFGATFAFFLRKKVVMRLFGVGSLIKRMSGIRKWLREPIRFLSYKAPFRYIICSKEGSGGQYFLERFVNKNVPYEVLLNGVDEINNIAHNKQKQNDFIRLKYNIPNDRKIILFLSRLSHDKGASLFIKTLIKLNETNRNFFAIVVGSGPLKEQLENEIKKEGLDNIIKFEGTVEHSMVYDYFSEADIYVSLNLLGNLCNTVLEAINAGKCIITFGKDEFDHTDGDTENILSGKAVLINKRNVLEKLPVALNDLLNNSSRIEELSQKAQELSIDLLKYWDNRINHEVELLQRIAIMQ